MPTENASITTPPAADPDRKTFTVAQANSALPYVSRVVEDITAVYGRIIELRRGADRPGTPADPGAPGGPQPDTEKEYEATMDRLSELVDELHAVGVELKDFELGLVDFPAVFEGRDVLLCWKRGEPDIGHWHEIDAGLSGRQPVALLQTQEA
jgi:hypothetical protein